MFLNFFDCWEKDLDPGLWLMNPDPGGPKHMDQDPEHWLISCMKVLNHFDWKYFWYSLIVFTALMSFTNFWKRFVVSLCSSSCIGVPLVLSSLFSSFVLQGWKTWWWSRRRCPSWESRKMMAARSQLCTRSTTSGKFMILLRVLSLNSGSELLKVKREEAF